MNIRPSLSRMEYWPLWVLYFAAVVRRDLDEFTVYVLPGAMSQETVESVQRVLVLEIPGADRAGQLIGEVEGQFTEQRPVSVFSHLLGLPDDVPALDNRVGNGGIRHGVQVAEAVFSLARSGF